MKKIQAKSRVLAVAILMILGTVSVQAQRQRGPHPPQNGQEQMHRDEQGPKRPGPPAIPGLTEEQKDLKKNAIPIESLSNLDNKIYDEIANYEIIDISNFVEGMYFLQLRDGRSKKFIKLK